MLRELPVYRHLPLRPVRAEGCFVWDERGRRFLDLYGGHAVALTGHSHPKVVAALREQAERLLFYSSAVPLDVREKLIGLLGELAPPRLTHVFFVNSGAEANEQALALARRATGRERVTVIEGGFHGRTLATLTASGIPGYRARAEVSDAGRRLTELVDVCPFDNEQALDELIGERTSALLLEPVQGLAGARVLAPEFLQRARELCDARGAALIFDEVQCGLGRCGSFSAGADAGITPDAMTLAKGLASGVPAGAVLVGETLARGVGTGDLGSTFGGGPLASAAAAATLQVITAEGLIDRARRSGERLREALGELSGVRAVQGAGLLIGLCLDRPAAEAQAAALARGAICGTSTDPHVLRLLPPLVLGQAEIELAVELLAEVLS